jgi:citrate lyase synthetase
MQLYRYFVSQSSEFCFITLCIASQRVFVVVAVYFVIDSVRKLLDTPSYIISAYFPNFVMKDRRMVSSCQTLSRLIFFNTRWMIMKLGINIMPLDAILSR